jgi:hypothetical protein
MREIEGDPEFVLGWNEQIQYQRVRKAVESQAIDLTLLASTPMHDRLTFECAEAVEEKMAERLRKGPPGKLYRGWMTEIDHQVAEHEQEESRVAAKRVSKRPHVPRCVMLCGASLSSFLKGEQCIGESCMLRGHDRGYLGGARRERGREELWLMLMTLMTTTTTEAIFHSHKQSRPENNKTILVCFFSHVCRQLTPI